MQTDLLEQAKEYHRQGLAVHFVYGTDGKAVYAEDWSNPPRLTIEDLKMVMATRGDILTGVGYCSGQMSGGLCTLDFDAGWAHSVDHFLTGWGELEHAALAKTAHQRRQMIVKILNIPADNTGAIVFKRGNQTIELRGNGCNNVLPNSRHPGCDKEYCTGESFYEWINEIDLNESPEVEWAELYKWLEEWADSVEVQPAKQQREKIDVPQLGDIDRMILKDEAQKAVRNAQRMIEEAQDGTKYYKLRDASFLLGGFTAYGDTILSRENASQILQAAIDQKPNVASQKHAYNTIEKCISGGEQYPFLASQILQDKADYASQNGNGTGTLIELPSVTVEGDEPEARHTTFKPWQWSEFLTRPPKQWFFENFIGPGDIVVLAGDSGSGKTVLAIDLAMCAIIGQQYAGRFDITQALKIAYCTAEGIGNLPARVKAARDKYNVPMSTIEANFFGYDGPIIPQFFLTSDNEYSIEQFERDLQTLGVEPDVLILDTLALAAINGNLEDNSDVTTALIRARQFTNRTGIAVLFTHHNNREGTFRGAASLRDNADGLFIARYDKERDQRKLLCKDDKG